MPGQGNNDDTLRRYSVDDDIPPPTPETTTMLTQPMILQGHNQPINPPHPGHWDRGSGNWDRGQAHWDAVPCDASRARWYGNGTGCYTDPRQQGYWSDTDADLDNDEDPRAENEESYV